jgi:hypothetical protein
MFLISPALHRMLQPLNLASSHSFSFTALTSTPIPRWDHKAIGQTIRGILAVLDAESGASS